MESRPLTNLVSGGLQLCSADDNAHAVVWLRDVALKALAGITSSAWSVTRSAVQTGKEMSLRARLQVSTDDFENSIGSRSSKNTSVVKFSRGSA